MTDYIYKCNKYCLCFESAVRYRAVRYRAVQNHTVRYVTVRYVNN